MFDFVQKLAFFPDKAAACVRDGIHRSLSTVFIDLVSGICNHNCIFCDGKYLPLENKRFSSERLFSMADELKELGVDSAIIVGEGGESTLHPDFCSFSKKLIKNGIHVGLYTNGETLCGEIAETASAFDFVRVSLDAGTGKTHAVVHRSGNSDAFDKIVTQLGAYSQIKNGKLGVSFIVLPENIDEIPLAAGICEKKGVDFLELKPFYSPNYSFDIPMYQELAKKLYAYYNEVSVSCKKTSVVMNNQFAEWMSYGFEPRDLTQLRDPRPCLTSKLRMVISPNGCFLCTCFRNVSSYNLGDPNQLSIGEIWFGEKHRELIQKKCALKCPYSDQNAFLLNYRDGECRLPECGDRTAQTYFL